MKSKKLTISFLVSFVVLTLCSSGFAADDAVQSLWTATPPSIDGSNEDWEGGVLTLNKKTQVDYAFRNDAENLYVIFIFNDPRGFMSTIQQSGITLWLNTEGKKKKDYGIKFGIKTVTAEEYVKIVEQMLGAPVPEDRKQQLMGQETYQIFHNQVIDKNGEAPVIASGPTAPAFNTLRGQATVAYEFKIPIKRDDEYPVGIGTTPGSTFTIGFEWGGTTKEMRQERLTAQTARGSAGTSGNASGSLTGEQGVAGASTTGGLGTMSNLRAVTYIFWSDVQLADKQ